MPRQLSEEPQKTPPRPYEEAEAPSKERVFTFYSFKGGVGRSLALYNVACVLAAAGRRVLMIDADLEAPGLSLALGSDEAKLPKEGFLGLAARLANVVLAIDTESDSQAFFEEYAVSWRAAVQELKPADRAQPDPLRARLMERFGDRLTLREGTVDLIAAGSPYENYADAVVSLRLRELFGTPLSDSHRTFAAPLCPADQLPAGTATLGDLYVLMLRKAIHRLRKDNKYDYVFIDSRTGWADVAGLCVRGLPDKLVLLFGLNEQSIRGTQQVLDKLPKSRRARGSLMLVASPIPNGEADLLAERLDYAARQFDAAVGEFALLHYYPRLALIEMRMAEPYRLARIAEDYRDLAKKVRELCGDTLGDVIREVAMAPPKEGGMNQRSLTRMAMTCLDDPVDMAGMLTSGYQALTRWLPHEVSADIARFLVALEPSKVVSHDALAESLGRLIGGAPDVESAREYFEEAVREFERARDLGDRPDRLEAAMGRLYASFASRLWQSGQLVEARQVFQGAFQKYARALEIAPERAGTANEWGNALGDAAELEGDAGRPDEARELFREAFQKYTRVLEIDPEHVGATNNWGVTLRAMAKLERDQGCTDQARQLLQEALEKHARAVEIDPEHAGATSNWGVTLRAMAELERDQRRTDQARQLLEEALEKHARAVEIDPEHAGTTNNWGVTLGAMAELERDQGRTDQARELLQEAFQKYARALEIDPEYAGAANNWGVALSHLGDFERDQAHTDPARQLFQAAFQKYTLALEIDSEDAAAAGNWGAALTKMAELERDQGRTVHARELFQEAFQKCARALEIDPRNAAAADTWGSALVGAAALERHEGDGAAACALIEQANEKLLHAEEIRPGSAQYNLACVAALRGDKEAAYGFLERCLPGNAPLMRHATEDEDLRLLWTEERFRKLTSGR